jgi:hypothetical protein
MSSNNLKLIKFVYQTNEHFFNVRESTPVEQLLDQVKIHFDIEADSSLELIDINTNITVVPALTADLFVTTTTEIPKYRINIRKSRKNIHIISELNILVI